MSPITQALFTSWSIDPKLLLAVAAVAVIYTRGWWVGHNVAPLRFPAWRLAAFLAGLLSLWIAIASPLDAFSGLLLSAHMLQHLLLMLVAPPLILLGSPFIPLVRGLPRKWAREGIAPFLASPTLRRWGQAFTHPVFCWLVMAAALVFWHIPVAFELALRSPGWHKFEHACFFGASLLFWFPIVRPFPSRPHWPLWTVPIYLLAADLLNTAVAAILTFSEHSLYATYDLAPRLFGTTALGDQSVAGVFMWVPGSFAFLVPGVILAIKFLSPANTLVRPGATPPLRPTPRRHRAGVWTDRRPFDLLRIPALGPFLKSGGGRRMLQALMLLLALAVMVDGFFGPQISSANLAGVLPWTYWRAFTVVALIVAGNFFCYACPFMLPRELGRRLGFNSRAWPRAFRSKWVAVALLVLFFWAYEAFAIWDRPAWTAAIILGYFVGAFVVDATFRGASFCKYVCPIGQFHFVTSLVSPLEVKIREPSVCAGCRTHDCLRGNATQRGCETELFLPKKSGNLDCTFCLDCVRACPHENIGVLAVAPGTVLLRDSTRSSMGRLSRRPDVAILALVLVAAAFVSAAAMIGRVPSWRGVSPGAGNLDDSAIGAFVIFAGSLLFLPVMIIGMAMGIGRSLSGVTVPTRELMCRFSLALVPLGVSMWAAHFLFHLLAGYAAGWPVLQQAAGGAGFPIFGRPDWALSSLRLNPDTILSFQIILLGAGLLLTLFLGWTMARQYAARASLSFALLVPWAIVTVLLYAAGVWILLQPMQMRGLNLG